jgi:sec-independent protein translocase protein TatA
MDLFAPKHLLIILIVVLLIFGTKKLKTLGPDLGAAIRGFKKSMKDGEDEEPKQIQQPQTPPPQRDAEFPDVAAHAPASNVPHGTENKVG